MRSVEGSDNEQKSALTLPRARMVQIKRQSFSLSLKLVVRCVYVCVSERGRERERVGGGMGGGKTQPLLQSAECKSVPAARRGSPTAPVPNESNLTRVETKFVFTFFKLYLNQSRK